MSKRLVVLSCFVLLCVCILRTGAVVADEAAWKSAKSGWEKALKLDPDAAKEVATRLSNALCAEVETDAAKIFIEILAKWSKNFSESESGRNMVDVISNAFGRFTTQEGISKLFSEVKSARQDLMIRVSVLKGLLSSPKDEVTGVVLNEFPKTGEKSLQMMMANYLGDNKIEKGVAALIAVLQQSSEWDITIAVARALKNFNRDDVIKALMDARGKQTGRTAYELQEIIDSMINAGKAPNPNPNPVAGASSVTYFGKPVVSKRIIFIVDISGSMSEAASQGLAQKAVESNNAGNAGAQGISVPPNTPQKKIDDLSKLRDQNNQRAVANKMDAVKKELIKTILALPHDVFFTIIFYSQAPSAWKEELCKAIPQNKLDAIEAIEKQSPNGQTNIYDSIEMAFKMSAKEGGRKPQQNKDKGGSSTALLEGNDGADTIYLLTDGVPNIGKISDAAGILKAVTELNKTRMIQINTIGVGQALDDDFLRKLAEQNGGMYIKADN
ncbi:MAG: VWA domain-containing protein [Planctomycetes bacterium]|nr:VWA domain-containing protein [Planctomycetota bacterium]